LQDRRVEAFGEPAVYWREKITGFGAFALVAPQAGEAGGGKWRIGLLFPNGQIRKSFIFIE
jgi:hypothetical protein